MAPVLKGKAPFPEARDADSCDARCTRGCVAALEVSPGDEQDIQLTK